MTMNWILKVVFPWLLKYIWPVVEVYFKDVISLIMKQCYNKVRVLISNIFDQKEEKAKRFHEEFEYKANSAKTNDEKKAYEESSLFWKKEMENLKKENLLLREKINVILDDVEVNSKENISSDLDVTSFEKKLVLKTEGKEKRLKVTEKKRLMK